MDTIYSTLAIDSYGYIVIGCYHQTSTWTEDHSLFSMLIINLSGQLMKYYGSCLDCMLPGGSNYHWGMIGKCMCL